MSKSGRNDPAIDYTKYRIGALIRNVFSDSPQIASPIFLFRFFRFAYPLLWFIYVGYVAYLKYGKGIESELPIVLNNKLVSLFLILAMVVSLFFARIQYSVDIDSLFEQSPSNQPKNKSLLNSIKRALYKTNQYSETKLRKLFEDAAIMVTLLLKKWSHLLLVWIVIYGVLVLVHLSEYFGWITFPYWGHTLLFNVGNSVTTIFLLMLYFVMADLVFDRKETKWPKALENICVGAFIATLADVALQLYLVKNEADSSVIQISSVVSGIIFGLFSALVLALLTGRFDSKFLGESNKTIIFLYLYCFFQVLFPVLYLLDQGPGIAGETGPSSYILDTITIGAFYFSFIAKFVIFRFIVNSVSNHKLLIYFIRIREYSIQLSIDSNEIAENINGYVGIAPDFRETRQKSQNAS